MSQTGQPRVIALGAARFGSKELLVSQAVRRGFKNNLTDDKFNLTDDVLGRYRTR